MFKGLLHKWFVRPIDELSIAMKNIAEGNLEYQLSVQYTGEVGELFHNYEEMRLRLKESTEESIENEKKK